MEENKSWSGWPQVAELALILIFIFGLVYLAHNHWHF